MERGPVALGHRAVGTDTVAVPVSENGRLGRSRVRGHLSERRARAAQRHRQRLAAVEDRVGQTSRW